MRQGDYKKYHVVVSSNERYMPGATVALASVALNAKAESYFVFHLFSEGVTVESINLLKRTLSELHPNGEFIHHPLLDKDLVNLPYWATSRMAAARCLYSEMLADVDWCLYLDCDVLYLASPEEHFEYCDDTKLAIVTQEQSKNTRERECSWIEDHCGVIVDDSEYFNSGVMLFNFKLMRKERISKKLLAFFAAHRDVASPDQDALNTLFVGRTLIIPPKWNRLQIFLDDNALFECPIIHYVSGIPWLPKLSLVANGRFYLWHSFADRFVWKSHGESCRRLFTKNTLLLKKLLYFVIKIPIVGLLFSRILKVFGLITDAKGWIDNQIKFDISQIAIDEFLCKHKRNY